MSLKSSYGKKKRISKTNGSTDPLFVCVYQEVSYPVPHTVRYMSYYVVDARNHATKKKHHTIILASTPSDTAGRNGPINGKNDDMRSFFHNKVTE